MPAGTREVWSNDALHRGLRGRGAADMAATMAKPRYSLHARALLVLGLPLIGSHVARLAIGVADTVMVGWYDVDALAALVIATSMQFVLFMLGSGFAIALLGVLANALARADDVQVRRATRMALWLSIAHALLIMPLLWWSGPILLVLEQAPVVAGFAQDYLRISGWGVGLILCGMVLNSYLAAMERTQILLWITVAGIPVNVALNWLLIFGHWGLPELGVRGAALASVAVQAMQLALMLAYALWLPQARRFALMQRFWRPDWGALRHVLWLGLPVGITAVAEIGLFSLASVMMGWIGIVALAAHGIAIQIAGVAFMVHLGLSNAATIRIGQTQGHGDIVAMREISLTVLWLSALVAAVVIAIFLTMPQVLVGAYLDLTNPQSAEILALASFLLIWAAAFQLADALQAIALGLLRGVQDTRVPMWITAFAYWGIGMPAAYLLTFTLDHGPGGVWAGLTIALVVAAVLLLWRFWRGLARGDWTRAHEAH